MGEGVEQELWRILLAYDLVRTEMYRVAKAAKVEPIRISFVERLAPRAARAPEVRRCLAASRPVASPTSGVTTCHQAPTARYRQRTVSALAEAARSSTMRDLVRHGVALAALALASACGREAKTPRDSSGTAVTVTASQATPDPAAAQAAPTALGSAPATPTSDAEILAIIEAENHAQIDLAELAKRTATDAEVKNYAAMILAQHGDMENKGRALARKARLVPAESAETSALKAETRSTLAALRTEQGEAFDRTYTASQVKAHKEMLAMIDDKLAPSARNGELRALLRETRSRAIAHLAKAEAIQAQLDSTGSPTK
jgi:putative membrane protein